MAKTLLTGATGFIGSHLARALARRGEDLRITVREGSDTQEIDDLDVEKVKCDVLDRRSVRRVLKGVDKVFHAAGMTSVRPEDSERLFQVNLGGVHTVLGECLRADVGRVILTSSAAALGPAKRGGLADEDQLFTAGHLGIPYVNSVHEAEVGGVSARGSRPAAGVREPLGRVRAGRRARDLHAPGALAFCSGACPPTRTAPSTWSTCATWPPATSWPTTTAKPGERYILGGRNFTFDRLFADLGRLSGVEPPLKVPRTLAAGVASMRRIGPGRTTLTPQEVLAASQFWTYRSTKAKRELGWSARPHEETLEATVAWYLEREHDRIVRTRRSQQLQYRVAGAAISAAEDALSRAGAWRAASASGAG